MNIGKERALPSRYISSNNLEAFIEAEYEDVYKRMLHLDAIAVAVERFEQREVAITRGLARRYLNIASRQLEQNVEVDASAFIEFVDQFTIAIELGEFSRPQSVPERFRYASTANIRAIRAKAKCPKPWSC